jgi:AcrR family transcriptional regulator
VAPQRGPYAKTIEVRKRIVAAAVELFGEKGYRTGSTVKEIAERAGISERGLVHHFSTKEDILLEVLGAHEAHSTRLVVESSDRISGMLDVARDNIAQPSMLELQTQLAAEATSVGHPAHQKFTQRYEELRGALADEFAELGRRGALVSGIAPELLAAMYIALLDGLQQQWLYSRASVDVDAALRNFLALISPSNTFGTAQANPIPSEHPGRAGTV